MSTVPVVLRLLRGAAAGAVATVPMSAVMLGAGKLGLMGEQPPEAIAKEAVADATGTEPHGATSDALASLAHLAFGAGAGLLHAGLPKTDRVPAPVSGMAIALAIWSASYQGWVPKIGALPHAAIDRNDRVAVMVGAHLLFGAVLGLLEERWSR